MLVASIAAFLQLSWKTYDKKDSNSANRIDINSASVIESCNVTDLAAEKNTVLAALRATTLKHAIPIMDWQPASMLSLITPYTGGLHCCVPVTWLEDL